MRLALGTAQLGMRYGVANTSGRPDEAEALAIVDAAWSGGVRFFDTAQAYGESQAVLGRCLRRLAIGGQARVVSKLDPAIPPGSRQAIRRGVERTLEELGVPSLWAFLLHRESLLAEWDGALGDALRELREEGRVERLGVSLYEPAATRRALEIPEMEVLQLPGSVFDRRMRRGGIFDLAANRGRQIALRSVYLQGLALMEVADLPSELRFARPAVAAYRDFCHQHGVDRRAFALAYAHHMAPDAWLVIGAETRRQCEENCRLARQAAPVGPQAWDDRWPQDDPLLVDPSRWLGEPR